MPIPQDNDDDDDDFDDLDIAELASLLKNFKELENDIQKQLVSYMKKLENTDPKKVTELKQYNMCPKLENNVEINKIKSEPISQDASSGVNIKVEKKNMELS